MWKEFKEFAVKGNAIDLAVGVIIGAAFGKIVTSLVEDLLMPPLGKVICNLDFSNLYIPLSDKIASGMSLADIRKAGWPVFAYGNFFRVRKKARDFDREERFLLQKPALDDSARSRKTFDRSKLFLARPSFDGIDLA